MSAFFKNSRRSARMSLNLLIRPDNAAAVRSRLKADGFHWSANEREFHEPSGLLIQLVLTGDKEGPGQPATFPDPSNADAVTQIEGLIVLSLAELIQSKLACGLGALRRTHKDFADVVESSIGSTGRSRGGCTNRCGRSFGSWCEGPIQRDEML